MKYTIPRLCRRYKILTDTNVEISMYNFYSCYRIYCKLLNFKGTYSDYLALHINKMPVLFPKDSIFSFVGSLDYHVLQLRFFKKDNTVKELIGKFHLSREELAKIECEEL